MSVSEVEEVRVRRRRRRIPGVSCAEMASQSAGDVQIPPEPTEAERALHDEQQVYRTEQMMLQGVFHVRELMQLLGIEDPRKMKRYIQRVNSRWMLEGRRRDLSVDRGRAIAELEWVTRQLRLLYEQASSVREKGAVLESISRLREKKNAVLGLTVERVQALNVTPFLGEDDLRGAVQQRELAEMVCRFAEMVTEEMEELAEDTSGSPTE